MLVGTFKLISGGGLHLSENQELTRSLTAVREI